MLRVKVLIALTAARPGLVVCSCCHVLLRAGTLLLRTLLCRFAESKARVARVGMRIMRSNYTPPRLLLRVLVISPYLQRTRTEPELSGCSVGTPGVEDEVIERERRATSLTAGSAVDQPMNMTLP
jgi:hypothetical protein